MSLGTMIRDPQSEFRPNWLGSSRVDACQRVRNAMADAAGLLPVAEAAAETILGVLGAATVSVTLLDPERDEYWDLVSVGALMPGDERFPLNARYPASGFPEATKRLLNEDGYLSLDSSDRVLVEYHTHWPGDINIGSIMGAPLVAGAEVRGEILVARDRRAPRFSRLDLDLAREMSTVLGDRLPSLLGEGDEQSLSRTLCMST